MKNVAALTEDGAFALFFRPHPGGFDSPRVPNPGNFPSKAKKNANARGSAPGGCWAQVELTGALVGVLNFGLTGDQTQPGTERSEISFLTSHANCSIVVLHHLKVCTASFSI